MAVERETLKQEIREMENPEIIRQLLAYVDHLQRERDWKDTAKRDRDDNA